MSVEDAADVLGIGRTKTYELLKARMLRSVTVGRRRLVPVAEVQRFAEELVAEQEAS